MVAATFIVPNGYCTQGPAENGLITSYWAGLEGGVNLIAQAGFNVACNGGQPEYYVWVAGNNGVEQPLAPLVQPGDSLTVTTWCPVGGVSCMLWLQDTTQNWFQSSVVSVPQGFAADVAAVAAENYKGGVYSDAVMVSGATVNGTPIGQYGPQPYAQPPSGSGSFGFTASLVPSAIETTGEDFSFSWDGYNGS